MYNKQRGLSLGGLLVGLFILIMVALLGMKMLPSYMEYRTARNAIEAIARDRTGTGSSVQDIRRAFDARAAIDDINAIRAADLDISKDGADVVISFAYRKEVPLFTGVGVYMDYAANSKGR
jgi:Domain of unknown function (DUF4845)